MSSRTEERIKLVMALTDKILKKTRTKNVDPPPVLEVKSWISHANGRKFTVNEFNYFICVHSHSGPNHEPRI